MKVVVLHAIVVALGLCLVGCGGGMSDEDRLKLILPNTQATFPVTGKVLVDGKPVPTLWVKLHPKETKPGTMFPTAQTDANGDFQMTTYLKGDGAPNGDYRVTVEWLQERVDGEWAGPSKLAGRYGSPKTTEFSVLVDGKPVTLPTLEVKARPDADKLTPERVR